MFYVKLGLSLYSHDKIFPFKHWYKFNCCQWTIFFYARKIHKQQFYNNWVTQRRHRFLVSVGVLRLQRLFGEGKHVFNVTRVSLKQINKVMSSRKIYEVAKLVSYNFEHLCLTWTWSWPSGNLSNHSPLLLSGISWAIDPPTPLEFPIPSVVGVWIFSGTTHSWDYMDLQSLEWTLGTFRLILC